jgi:hypothetical protein
VSAELTDPIKVPFKVVAGTPEGVNADMSGNRIDIKGSRGVATQQGRGHTMSDNSITVDQKWAQDAAATDPARLVNELAELQNELKLS